MAGAPHFPDSPSHDPKPPAELWSAQRLRILIVHADPAGADALDRLVRQWGCDAVVVHDAAAALALAAAYRPEACLLDFGLGLAAFDLARQLLHGSDVEQVFFVAAGTGAEGREPTGSRPDFSFYFLRPIDPAILLAELSLHKRRHRDEAEPALPALTLPPPHRRISEPAQDRLGKGVP
jgi:DNA-binding response OmpR family regulator